MAEEPTLDAGYGSREPPTLVRDPASEGTDAGERDDSFDDDEDSGDNLGLESDGPKGRTARVPLWIVIPVAIFTGGGAIIHAVEPRHVFPNLNTDIVEVSWIVLFLLIVLLNFAEKVGFPGAGSVTLRRERAERAATVAIDATKDLEDARNRLAQLLEGWTNAAALLTSILEKYGADEQAVNEITTRFVLDRMDEARRVLAPESERIRCSLWWYSGLIGGLAYLYGTEDVDDITLNAVFHPREGLLGQAFVENQMYNLRSAPRSIYFKRHRKQTGYHGLMLVPVRESGTRPMGMISVDRASKREFDATAEAVGWALSDLTSLAYTHPLVMRHMPSYRNND